MRGHKTRGPGPRAVLSGLLLLAVGCRSRVGSERPEEFHVGIGASTLPGAGISVVAGQRFLERRRFDYAFELGADWQADAEFFQAQMGVKQTASPGYDRHLFFRYGATWFRVRRASRFIDAPGDYFGIYAGAGYQWDIGQRVSLAPEARVVAANGEGGLGTAVFPQIGLQLIFRF